MHAFAAFFALFAAANAHMIMKTPTPAFEVNSSPLDGSGSDFPCKLPGGSGTISSTNKNQMTIGQSNVLSFTGSAVHGGGSCQVSLAKTTQVDKNTKWMVIHSIEGGCPSSAAGNLPADPNGNGASQFSFTVPDHPDLGAGSYTLAWTWHNKIGNREMYMNCAYVELTGGAAKKRYMPTSKRADAPLPAMFVANIGNGCTVTEGTDVQYPNPGSSVEKGAGASLGAPVGSCGSAGSGSDSGSSPVVSSSPSAVASNTVQPIPSGAPSGYPSGAPTGFGQGTATDSPYRSSATGFPGGQRTQSQGGSFATISAGGVESSAVAPQAPSATSAVSQIAPSAAASSVAAAPVAPSAAAPAAPISTGTTGSGSVSATCSTENNGAWNCAADGKSFQRCASGAWSASIQMSAGLTCVPGISMDFAYNLSGTNAKRDLKSHIARRRHSLHGSFLS